MTDLGVVIVAIPGEPEWLQPCVRSLQEHLGGLDVQVVVVENDGTGRAREALRGWPAVTVVECENRGFGHGNNVGVRALGGGPDVLFLNPDTVVADGSLAALRAALLARPRIGVVGGRQVLPDGTVLPVARRFPTALRALGEALGAERFPGRATALRERELDVGRYAVGFPCDWVSGACMLVRREALDFVGGFDERFFLYVEEVDLCRRIRDAGFEVRYSPALTVVHHVHGGDATLSARGETQAMVSRRLYAQKHMSPLHAAAYLGAHAVAAGVRLVPVAGAHRPWAARVAALRRTLRVVTGRQGSPYRPASDHCSDGRQGDATT